jgi:Mannosyltransferase (PIG-V)
MSDVRNQLASTMPAAAKTRGGKSALEAAHASLRRLGVGARAAGWHSTWSDFWRSRLLIWMVGATAFLVMGPTSTVVKTFDPSRLSVSLGRIGNVLAAPAVRWDAIWYLRIAHDGYSTSADARFFPLYPLLMRVGSWFTGSPVIAGVLISMVSLFVGLELIRRLTELELGAAPARATISLIAFGPLALFLSAVYSEALFLALSAGTFYAARRGRWAWVGVLGGLAATTRIAGFLIFAPALVLYYFGPRSDAPPMPVRSWWKPRYRARPDLLWLVLIPAAAALVPTYMLLRGLGPAATLSAQEKYSDHAIVFPLVGAWQGLVGAWHQLMNFQTGTYSGQEVFQFAALILGCVALVGVFRRLPLAYGVYVALDFVLNLSTPTVSDTLLGFDRYASLRFPLFMWLGAWASERKRMRPLLAISLAMLAFFTVQFATWHWVGTASL